MWLALDVLNPETAGHHRILILEDVLAKKRGSIRDVPAARAILMFATTLADCTAEKGLCARMNTVATDVLPQGGLLVAVLIESAENISKARTEVLAVHLAFPVTGDSHRIVRHALQIDRPGEMIMINSQGRLVRFPDGFEKAWNPRKASDSRSQQDEDRKVEDVRRVFLSALVRDKEDEQ